MSIANAPRRLDAQESKAAAIKAAHRLLISEGAAAITLQAVAKKIGRTHANLLHHFGSAAGLQRALAERIAEDVAKTIAATVASRRRGEASPRDVVNALFDAFERDRVGELIGWIALTRQREALAPVTQTIAGLLAEFRASGDDRPLERVTLGLVLLAVGDSLVGEEVAAGAGLSREAAREDATALIEALVEPPEGAA